MEKEISNLITDYSAWRSKKLRKNELIPDELIKKDLVVLFLGHRFNR